MPRTTLMMLSLVGAIGVLTACHHGDRAEAEGEGGERGGRVIACGPPEKIARSKGSHTGRYLAPFLG